MSHLCAIRSTSLPCFSDPRVPNTTANLFSQKSAMDVFQPVNEKHDCNFYVRKRPIIPGSG